jgi:hypothetical protein
LVAKSGDFFCEFDIILNFGILHSWCPTFKKKGLQFFQKTAYFVVFTEHRSSRKKYSSVTEEFSKWLCIGCPSTFDRKVGHVPTSTLKKRDILKFLTKMQYKIQFLVLSKKRSWSFCESGTFWVQSGTRDICPKSGTVPLKSEQMDSLLMQDFFCMILFWNGGFSTFFRGIMPLKSMSVNAREFQQCNEPEALSLTLNHFLFLY